jgi:hypothetical protein
MPDVPHDLSDLHFAPVALRVDARISDLAQLDDKELRLAVGMFSDEPDWTESHRRSAILRAVAQPLDLRGWELSWEDRGIRLSHENHSIVLGVPASFSRYVMQPAAV